ncbi:MAG: hypothetical protein ACREHV_06935 [Rhizomicrobium sp.]
MDGHRHGHNETLNFSGFSGYYGSIPSGYGGFDWTDLDYLNTASQGEAAMPSVGYGAILSVDLSETFSLKSMIAASAAETNQPFDFRSYAYESGKGFSLKASDNVYLSQTPEKIDFAKIGAKGDFQHIAAATIIAGTGTYGNASNYGYNSHWQLIFDDLKVHWNGKIPDGHFDAGHARTTLPYAHHAIAAHLLTGETGALSEHGAAGSHADHDLGTGYHSMLTSLDTVLGHTDAGDLSAQFTLSPPEHFGT